MASLDSYPDNPAMILALQRHWDNVWTPAVKGLFPNRVVSENESLAERFAAELNPVTLARDKAIETLLKKYGPKVILWGFQKATSTAVSAITTFLDPNVIATDYEELRYFDISVNKKAFRYLEPYLQADWRKTLSDALQRSLSPTTISPANPSNLKIISQ